MPSLEARDSFGEDFVEEEYHGFECLSCISQTLADRKDSVSAHDDDEPDIKPAPDHCCSNPPNGEDEAKNGERKDSNLEFGLVRLHAINEALKHCC